MSNFQQSFLSLKDYCEKEQFKGWDPYDGLNSKFFNALPLKHWDLARLAWIQGFKRSPINFRSLFAVPKEYNAKGVGLFLSGYCNLYKVALKGDHSYGAPEALKAQIDAIAEILLSLKTEGFSGACWGYNFDWQARRLFLFPKNTPTVVATTFCTEALFSAYEITKNESYLTTALSATKFVMQDLSRTPHNDGFLFSYSPLDGNNTVFNASLLGAKLLSLAYKYSKDETFIKAARESVLAVCQSQETDGSWVYGLLPVQSWKDSFHTGYNLEAIQAYQDHSGDLSFNKHLNIGTDFYLNNFFEVNGMPKYYHNKTYPIDIHCPGQLFVTLSKLEKFQEHQDLAKRVLNWSLDNMQDKKGYFYYQLKKGMSSKISYMRWSNAFMFNALSYYALENEK